ncbi:thiol-disulfide isomerase [Williamsia sp. Leaf354]|jgi:glutaredoxin|uniref:glutaredoxin family protein n=1 Tax=Williamsia sp. Leaf354 TaxID=1736349 RepID=UPI0006FB54FE|nr:glutaredoxin family protein [Williamsia sp. Leaf354]KQR96312.1 thiol-disulfide isomerase [Williamsia sp. Leaf354]MCX6469045.1 glutaredoxin family protein [Mycobacteriales bacterium]
MVITLLTRAGCPACARALEELQPISVEYDTALEIVDVDAAAAHDPSLRAEFGDRLPVVLLDEREHSYGEVDMPRLRADLDAAR